MRTVSALLLAALVGCSFDSSTPLEEPWHPPTATAPTEADMSELLGEAPTAGSGAEQPQADGPGIHILGVPVPTGPSSAAVPSSHSAAGSSAPAPMDDPSDVGPAGSGAMSPSIPAHPSSPSMAAASPSSPAQTPAAQQPAAPEKPVLWSMTYSVKGYQQRSSSAGGAPPMVMGQYQLAYNDTNVDPIECRNARFQTSHPMGWTGTEEIAVSEQLAKCFVCATQQSAVFWYGLWPDDPLQYGLANHTFARAECDGTMKTGTVTAIKHTVSRFDYHALSDLGYPSVDITETWELLGAL